MVALCFREKAADQRNKTERSLNRDVDKTPGIHLNAAIRIFVFNIKCIPFDISLPRIATTQHLMGYSAGKRVRSVVDILKEPTKCHDRLHI